MRQLRNGKLVLLKPVLLKNVRLVTGSMLFVAGYLAGQAGGTTQKTTIHAVAWTPQENATPQAFEDFKKATEHLVEVMPGLQRAWVGKLRRPLVHGDVTRTYGLVLEFDDVDSKVAYSSHSTRAPWAEVWSKVRVPGSTNFDVIGE